MSGGYIEKDAFGRAMYHAAFETDTDMQRWDSGCWIRYKLFENILDKQPTADVRENVHGKWMYLYEDNYKCSICGSWWCCTDSQIDEMNYCPNCGSYNGGES